MDTHLQEASTDDLLSQLKTIFIELQTRIVGIADTGTGSVAIVNHDEKKREVTTFKVTTFLSPVIEKFKEDDLVNVLINNHTRDLIKNQILTGRINHPLPTVG